jgi:hypothetical protein
MEMLMFELCLERNLDASETDEQRVPFRNDRKKGKGNGWVRFVCPTLSKIRKRWGTRICDDWPGKKQVLRLAALAQDDNAFS